MMTLRPDIHERLLYGKYLFRRAAEMGSGGAELGIATELLLMHDATELIMLAVLDHIGAKPKAKRDFLDFYEEVGRAGHTAPRSRLLMEQLNTLRISLKHKGVLPRAQSVRKLAPRVEAFLEHIAQDYLGVSFADVCLADLIENADVRNLLKQAEGNFSHGRRTDAFISVRTAFLMLEDASRKIVPFLNAPRAPDISSILPAATTSQLRLSRDWERYLESLHTVIQQIAGMTNLLMLRVDPQKYWYFLQATPSVYRISNDKFQPGPLRRDWESVPEPVFRSCVDFVIEYALATATLFRPPSI